MLSSGSELVAGADRLTAERLQERGLVMIDDSPSMRKRYGGALAVITVRGTEALGEDS